MTDTARLLEQNLRALGPNANERIERVATWLGARGGARGQEMATLLRTYPAVALVEGYEAMMIERANQRGANSGSHRETQTNSEGKIPGFGSMSMIQRRVAQMAERARVDPNYATGSRYRR